MLILDIVDGLPVTFFVAWTSEFPGTACLFRQGTGVFECLVHLIGMSIGILTRGERGFTVKSLFAWARKSF